MVIHVLIIHTYVDYIYIYNALLFKMHCFHGLSLPCIERQYV